MQKVWIFGDSYAANSSNEDYAWPNQLSKKYDVTNWAKSGTGPEYMMKVFKKELESSSNNVEDLKEISLIFFLSHDSRKDFSFLTNSEDQCLMIHIASKKKFKDEWSFNKSIRYQQHQHFLSNFYKNYYLHEDLSDFRHLQYVGILKEYSRFFKKCLVVSVFDRPDASVLHQKFNTTIQDTDNFCYAKGPALYEVEKEINKDMPNHLSIENHNLMFEQLVDWIENSVSLDTKNLKTL